MAKAKAALVPTRGERNNNPGNIDYSPRNKWVGQLGIEPPPNPSTRPRFARFDSPLNGGRAVVVLMQNYQDDKGKNTVRGLIETYAPPNENRTNVYVDAVARAVGVDPGAVIDVHQYRYMRPLLEAIIRHENGRVIYSPAEIDEMLRRGGVVNPAAPAVPSPTAPPAPKKSAVASPGISGLGVASTPAAIASEPNLRAALESSGYLWPLAVLGVAGVLLSAYVAWRTLRPKPEAA
jgi:hypothetical protein